MANAVEVDTTVNNLVNDVFGGGMWQATSLLDKIGDKSALGTMVQMGYVFAALMLIFQLVITVLNISKSPQVWENIGPLMFRTILISALISSPLYELIFRYTISGITDQIANSIFSNYAKDFLNSWKDVFKGAGETPSTPWGILLATFNNSLVSNILSSIIFIAAIVCVFLVSMLQPFLWLFFYYVGPICLAFSLCDLTVHIAKNWFNMFLVINFVGIFGSISFVVAQAANLMTNFKTGTSANNIILVAVYGVMSIIFFCSVWPLTAYIFSGSSSIGSVATPQAAIRGGGRVAGGSAIAYGAGMVATGVVLSKMGGSSAVGRIGNGMQTHGSGVMTAGKNIYRLASGQSMLPKNSLGGNQQGSRQTSSSIPKSDQSNQPSQPKTTV